jgi:hypothetical protein
MEEPAAAPAFLVEKARAFQRASKEAGAQEAEPVSANQAISPSWNKDGITWFSLELQVVLCALGLSYDNLRRSTTPVDPVSCWAPVKNLFGEGTSRAAAAAA